MREDLTGCQAPKDRIPSVGPGEGGERYFGGLSLEFTYALGPPAGRYRVGDPPEDVLVLSAHGAAIAEGGLLRRRRRPSGTADEPEAVTVQRVALVRAAQPLGLSTASSWLRGTATDAELRATWVGAALQAANVAIRAHRLAVADPYAVEVTAADVRVARLIVASAEQLAAGTWEEARAVPARRGDRTRDEEVRSGAQVAAALAGRQALGDAHDLALRALLDLEHGRPRAAAMGLQAAVLLGTAEAGPGGDRLDDVRDAADAFAMSALAGDLPSDDQARLADALRAVVGALGGPTVR